MDNKQIADKAAMFRTKELTWTESSQTNNWEDMSWLITLIYAESVRETLSTTQIESFKKRLSENICYLLENTSDITLGVTIYPDVYLEDALISADIPADLLPQKTIMRISRKWISVEHWKWQNTSKS